MKKTYKSQTNTQKSKIIVVLFLLITIVVLLSSCVTRPPETQDVTIASISPTLGLMDAPTKNASSLVDFFMEENPLGNREKVVRLADFYIEEAKLEGVNSDVAFAQMCLETGFLRFGGLVTEEMNNFCGLGAIDETQRGNIFATEQEGVRAHIQHIKAYGSPEPLNMPLVDPRYKWVNPKGKAPTVHGLAGTWAADPQYGIKLEGMLSRMAWY